MQTVPITHKIIQIFSILFLMCLMAWLATGWQLESELSYTYHSDLQAGLYFEGHLIKPVGQDSHKRFKDSDKQPAGLIRAVNEVM